MPSAYAEVGPRLVERGYSVIPIHPGSKAPGFFSCGRWSRMERWSEFCDRLPGSEEVSEWATWPKAGVGLCLGPASGLVAIDYDRFPQLWIAFEDLAPKSPVVKRGEKGYSAFYRYRGEPSLKKSHLSQVAVELLSTGRQTIIPPTVHPTTERPYAWDAAGLLDVERDGIPYLPENFAELFGYAPRPAPVIYTPAAERPSLDMLERALHHISADVPYPEWVNVGMAIHSAYPDDDGLRLFDRWSARGELYKPGEPAAKWRSFSPAGGITVGTLFSQAKLGGFSEWHLDEDRALEGVSAVLIPAQKKSADGEQPRFTLSSGFIARAPGLVGEIAQWIVSTASQPQPVLALAAALAAVATIKAHRVRTETNLRSNLYALGLADSGSGKNHPIEAVRRLFRACCCDDLLGGEPASEPGLCQIIREGHGRSLVVWDEFGHAISAMSSPRAGSHYSQIMATLTRLFSEAGSYHQGKVLAVGGRENIEQPCLSVLGLTVSERFFETLTKEHAIDGFLPRWLVFEVETNNPPFRRGIFLGEPPDELVARVRAVLSMPMREIGDLPDVIKPTTIRYTAEASECYWDARERFARHAQEAQARGEPTRAVWMRAAEHAAKVALVLTEDAETGMRELSWALELVELQCGTLCAAIGHRVGQNETERNTKRVLDIIRRVGGDGVTRSQLCVATQWLNQTERNGIITTLIDSEQIAKLTCEKKGSGRKSVAYKCL
jgi:hypothetical protein